MRVTAPVDTLGKTVNKILTSVQIPHAKMVAPARTNCLSTNADVSWVTQVPTVKQISTNVFLDPAKMERHVTTRSTSTGAHAR